jgi:hypothetical protein
MLLTHELVTDQRAGHKPNRPANQRPDRSMPNGAADDRSGSCP